LFTLSGHGGGVDDAAFSPGCVNPPESPFAQCGRYLATVSRDKTTKIWDVTPAGNREVISVPGNISFFSSVDKRLVTGTFTDQGRTITYHTWDMTTRGKEREITTFSVSHPVAIIDGGVNPEATLAGTLSFDGTVKILDLTTGKVTLTFKPPEPMESAVDISILASRPRLSTISPAKELVVWDAISGKKIASLPEFQDPVTLVAFSPDGSQLIVTSDLSSTATLWDLETGKKLFDLIGHTQPLYNAVFSQDGKRLATVGKDGTAIVWGVQTGKRILTLPGHSASVQAVVFSKDGTRLATGSVNGSVKVWDIAPGPTVGQELLNLSGYSSYIYTVDFSSDGKTIAASSFADGITRVYVLQLEDLISIAHSRLTRSFTLEECQKYLHQETCP
jgi:WD40 repeat protein